MGRIGQKGFHVGHRVLGEIELEFSAAGQAVVIVVVVAAVAVIFFVVVRFVVRFVVLFRISIFLRTPVTSALLFLLPGSPFGGLIRQSQLSLGEGGALPLNPRQLPPQDGHAGVAQVNVAVQLSFSSQFLLICCITIITIHGFVITQLVGCLVDQAGT